MGISSGIQLSARDTLLIETLTHRVRLLSLAQAARAFWSDTKQPAKNARRRLAQLSDEGMLKLLLLPAHPELDLQAPVCMWSKGAPQPDPGPVSYQLKSRWTRPLVPTQAIIATERAGNWMGGSGGRHPRPSEATHDIHLAAVYLHIMRSDPGRAKHWLSEAQLYARGGGRNERLPDALIRGPRETTVIEFGGAYSKRKLADFHEHCAQRGLAYEIW